MSEDTEKPINEEKDEKSSAGTTADIKLPSLYHNYLSLGGFVIAVASLLSIFFLFVLELTESSHQPYLGILIWILLPGVMAFGLFIVLVGMLFERRRRRKLTPEQIAAYPILDLNDARRRRIFITFL